MASLLNVYVVNFYGHYPVGAVAIVTAPDIEKAHTLFMATLANEEPDLVKANKKLTASDYQRIIELNSGTTYCKILLNGNY